MAIVLVTEPEFKRGEPVFVAVRDVQCTSVPAAETDLVRAIADTGARHVIIGSHAYTSAFYAALPRGSVIARFGVGHDNVDKAKATDAGILCTNTPGVLDQSVAEHAMLLMLAAARHFTRNTSDMRRGTWDLGPSGFELRGKTLAVIGCGRIGRATARAAVQGFGMRAVGLRRSGAAVSTPDAEFESTTTDFASAVRGADFVSLHITAETGNHHFLNAERLAMLSPRTWLINTARGAVVDEGALYDALSTRRLAGAALDVFQREPYVPADPARDFRTLDNVILTPHVGTHTYEANAAMAKRALDNIRLALTGDVASMDLVNPQVLGSDPGLTPV